MGANNTQQDVLVEISEKLDSILGFMAIKGVEGDVGKVVARLRDMGMSQKSIARVAGITENAVEIRLRRLKHPQSKKKKKASKKSGAKSEVPGDAPIAQPAEPSDEPVAS